jgi:hypothetical protein
MLVLILYTRSLQAGINGVGFFTGYDPYRFGLVVASSAGSFLWGLPGNKYVRNRLLQVKTLNI